MGVPTVGGEVNFHPAYNGNILVNAMCVGPGTHRQDFLSAAKGAGNPVVYVGSKTGRDGIHGATMASAEFSEDSKRSARRCRSAIRSPEKLLLEACLELMATDAIIAIQDMGAAGSDVIRLRDGRQGGTGIELDLDHVPQREANMTAYEMMLSESQERMLMVLKPGRENKRKPFLGNGNWISPLSESPPTPNGSSSSIRARWWPTCPSPRFPTKRRSISVPTRGKRSPYGSRNPASTRPARRWNRYCTLLESSDLCSRRWVWEQYDYSVMADTIEPPGGDAAVVRVHGTKKALAISCDVTPRYCKADPFEGAKQAVAESWRNLTAVGAVPLAITDNLNFGNPERPETMGEIVASIDGIGEAALVLSFPVVSGNCSLYNETNGEPISADARNRRRRPHQGCALYGERRFQA